MVMYWRGRVQVSSERFDSPTDGSAAWPVGKVLSLAELLYPAITTLTKLWHKHQYQCLSTPILLSIRKSTVL